MAPLYKKGQGVLCQHTETWILSLDNLTDFLMFSQTTLPNSDSTGAFLWGPAVSSSPVIQTGHFFVWPICLLVTYLPTAPAARQHKHDLEEGSILQKPLQHPIILFIPKERTQTGKKDHLESRSQQQFSGVEHWRLIQTCCWRQEQKGNALMASKV